MPDPQLLVSVRNVEEASQAILAGTQIIDLKEPERGALGKVDGTIIQQTMKLGRGAAGQVEFSAAWGELADFLAPTQQVDLSGLNYIKIGLAGMGSVPDWPSRWIAAKETLLQRLILEPAPKWIAVAYVDYECCDAPPADEVVDAAITQGGAGVLFDTYRKTTGSLVELVSPHQLKNWCTRLHSSGQLGVAAGKVALADLAEILKAGPDVIGVRSAACRHGNRNAEIDPDAIRQLLTEISLISQPCVTQLMAGAGNSGTGCTDGRAESVNS